MQTAELTAFTAECEATEKTLRSIEPGWWQLPGLGEWSVAELAGHLVRGATRVDAYLDRELDGAEPTADRVSYWHFDLAGAAPGIAQRARDVAAESGPSELPQRFADGWRASAARAETLAWDHLLQTFRGPMRLDEYLATRVLEVVVHHMDLNAALGRPPEPTPDGAKLTMSLLEGLLGADKPHNFGRARFIKAATGRIAVDDPRFPVLS
jgi:uncharacterized protein (TIGR03083 family)